MTPQQRDAAQRADRRISDADAELIATHLVDKLVTSLSDEKVVAAIADVWGTHIDRHIGATVRRGAYAVIAGTFLLVGFKLDIILNWLKPH